MTSARTVSVDPTNLDQLHAWDGDEGAFWAAHSDHFEKALTGYDRPFFEAAAICPTDRVLDVGCGTGQTTRNAAKAASDGSVLGVDLSAAMLDVARRRARDEGISNVGFEQVDAQIHEFEPGTFDVAIGRTSAMFFGDRVAALANIGGGLRPGGRLVLLTWQALTQQEWIRDFAAALAAGRVLPAPPPDAPGPFTLSEPAIVRSVLAAAGYTDVGLVDQRHPMWFGDGTENAHDFVLGQLGWMLEGLNSGSRARAENALHATIAAHETPDGVIYDSAAWIVSATRC